MKLNLKKLPVQKLSARKSTKILINFHNEYKDLKKKWKIKKSTMELRMKSFRNKVSRKKIQRTKNERFVGQKILIIFRHSQSFEKECRKIKELRTNDDGFIKITVKQMIVLSEITKSR